MREKDFEKGFETLKKMVNGCGDFGPNVLGYSFNPDHKSKDEVEAEGLRLLNENVSSLDFEFEKDDIVFEETIDQDGKQIFIKHLSDELLERIKRKDHIN